VPLIDQRILIAAPAEAVWTFLISPPLLVKWHKGCKQVSILSTRTTGPGTRRRVTDPRGKTVVEEITHWLENLGYEYQMIDGPYRAYRGRIRLQAIPEGTVVNWTIEFQLRGMLPVLRILLGARRRMENMMADSLRQLRRLVEHTGARIDPEKQARFAMRAAPSVEDRAAARAVAVPSEAPAEQPLDAEAPTPPAGTPEPSFVAGLESAPPPIASFDSEDASLADTKPRAPKGLREAIARQMAELPATEPQDEPSAPAAPAAEWDSAARTVPVSLVAPAPPDSGEQETQTMEIVPPSVPDTLPESVPTPRSILLPKMAERLEAPKGDEDSAARRLDEPAIPTTPPPTTPHDTGEISIWDVFGMMPPSERTRTELEKLITSLQSPVETHAKAPTRKVEHARRAESGQRARRRRANPPVRAAIPYPARGKARMQARRATTQRR
jgi:hypothetical protein